MGLITVVAGTMGKSGDGGDGGPATGAELSGPLGIAVTADGGFLIADSDNNLVRKVSASGVINHAAGKGIHGTSGGAVTVVQLSVPTGLAVTADGGFLIADTGNQLVRKVSAGGVITQVAGIGVAGRGGDDGPAVDARLNNPMGIAATADGGFLIADVANNAVRKVSAGGVVSRAAGTGVMGAAGDDGPAVDAQLNQPCGVAVTADGGFLIADTFNHAVRKVSADGVISRVAGSGVAGAVGDGGPAVDAQLNQPSGVAVTADGGFLIADTGNNAVRKVSADGVISRVAGSGVAGSAGDGGPAVDAQLNQPVAVAATADGGFLIADSYNMVVRKVSADGGAPPS